MPLHLRTDAQGGRSSTSRWATVRKTIGIVLTATTISLGTAGAATAATAVPSGFVGVSDWGWPTSEQSAQLGADGVGTFRAGVAWEWVEPQQGQRNWGGVDGLFANASAHGYDLLLVLNGCTQWACGATRTAPQTPQQRAWFQDYVSALIGRYGAGGTFWKERPELRPVPASWQVWNEVNVGADWPNPTAGGYASLLAETSATIKRVDPSATVVSAGLAELPAVPEGAPLARFLSELERDPSFRSSADVVAVHGYAEDARGTARVLDTARRVMLAAGDTRPLWVTELGWGSGGPAHPFVRTPEGQAAELRSAYDLLTACRARWSVDKAIWFGLRDVRPEQLGEGDYWGMYTGLYAGDGVTAKPAAAALREYAGGRTLPDGRADSCPLPGGADPAATLAGGRGPAVTVVRAPKLVGAAALRLGVVEAGRGGSRAAVSEPAGARASVSSAPAAWRAGVLSKPAGGSKTAASPAKIDFVIDAGNRAAAECSLDGGGWEPCSTPYVIKRGAEGPHTLQIRGVLGDGTVSAQPASVTWTVDTTAPDTKLRKKPARIVRRGAVVKLKLRKAGEPVTHECSLRRGSWKRCKATVKLHATKRGTQRLRIRAVDAAGNADPTPVLATYRVR